jgi:hypothetical protein
VGTGGSQRLERDPKGIPLKAATGTRDLPKISTCPIIVPQSVLTTTSTETTKVQKKMSHFFFSKADKFLIYKATVVSQWF